MPVSPKKLKAFVDKREGNKPAKGGIDEEMRNWHLKMSDKHVRAMSRLDKPTPEMPTRSTDYMDLDKFEAHRVANLAHVAAAQAYYRRDKNAAKLSTKAAKLSSKAGIQIGRRGGKYVETPYGRKRYVK